MTNLRKPTSEKQLRCAVYTRKSTEEGLEQEFNTLDAQWESGAAYIKSQASERWTLVPTRYDDGGFSGGNLDRPALRRLLADIEAGKIDIVVVYKVDRLSRSLLDFSRLLEVFDKHRVGFVSVTQQFSTTTSTGRLMLNVLLSFAQFEREIISERTRDKMAAARRKGKWLGGRPVLGYGVDPSTKQLVLDDVEAAQVRAIFELYLEYRSTIAVVQELNRRGWVNKTWSSKKGKSSGGSPFTKATLHSLLTNPTYIGKVTYKDEVYAGEHTPLIDAGTWQKVQSLLKRNGSTGGVAARNKYGALLRGLLFCKPCGCAMSPTHTKKGNKLYRYYLCGHAAKSGWSSCPSKSIPAGEIENFATEQVRGLVKNPAVVNATITQVQVQRREQTTALLNEQRGLERDRAHWNRELQDVVLAGATGTHATARLADLQERIAATERRLTEIQSQVNLLDRANIDADFITAALSNFDALWQALTPREQVRIVELVINRIDYDGSTGKVAVTFREDAMPLLAQQLTNREEAA